MKINFDRELVLGGHFLLKHLNKEQIRAIAATTTLSDFPRGGVIFQKGDPGTSMMAVIRGKVKICTYSTEGKELVLNMIKQGGLFGEISLLDGAPRSADAVAMEETHLLVLERSRFLPFLRDHPEVATKLITVLCQRLRQTSEHLEDTMFREAPSRLARCLLRLGEDFGKPIGDHLKIDIKLSQQQLGGFIGVSRESVNKHMNDWIKNEFITVESSIVTILDRDALEDLVENPENDDE